MAAEQFTELRKPPEYRGEGTGPYLAAIYTWAARYHQTLEPLVKECIQLKADVAAIGQLTQAISNPPTQAEVQAIQTNINAIVAAAAT